MTLPKNSYASLLAFRLRYFTVGLVDDVDLLNENPTLVAPTMASFSLCGQYLGEVPAGEWGVVNCWPNAHGRYLVIQIVGEHDCLTLCEVQAFGSSK